MKIAWDTDLFPCPHCLVEALVRGAINIGADPTEIAELVIKGLRDGLGDDNVVKIVTNRDTVDSTDTMH